MIETTTEQFQALMDEAEMEQDALCLETLARVEGVGRQTLFQLLRKAGSPQALWEADVSFLRENLPDKKREAFLKMQKAGLNFSLLERVKKHGVRLLAYTHPLYPPLLKEIHNPPAFLYIQGNIEALSGRTVAVVGTRKATEYGRQVTEKLIGEVQSAQVTIVSGLAAGIDTAAHWAAIRQGLPTVAVFGCGLDVIFPSSNRKLSQEIVANGGALVSEYPLGMAPTQYTFPQRNRIVAGLSHGLLVIEGDLKSGALITARLALEEGRTVFAVPGNIFNPGHQGPMSLLKSGAVPVDCGEDILKELQWWMEEKVGVPILTDVHSIEQVMPAAEVVDMLQIPAFLCRQTDLLLEAGRSNIPVNIKKGQFMAPLDTRHAANKVKSMGNEQVYITERGSTFGYNNLVVDMRSIPMVHSLGLPLIFDATHSVQLPGGAGETTGGNREFAPLLAKCAVSAGCDGLFFETHPEPEKGLSDASNMLPLAWVEPMLKTCMQLREIIQNEPDYINQPRLQPA